MEDYENVFDELMDKVIDNDFYKDKDEFKSKIKDNDVKNRIGDKLLEKLAEIADKRGMLKTELKVVRETERETTKEVLTKTKLLNESLFKKELKNLNRAKEDLQKAYSNKLTSINKKINADREEIKRLNIQKSNLKSLMSVLKKLSK